MLCWYRKNVSPNNVIISRSISALVLWGDSPTDKLNVYKIRSVTFGTSSALYLATKCLQVIANKVADSHPEISNVLKLDFYMDNPITGMDYLKKAK